MQYRNKCNYISIAKAIGIILMVMGHSGCPKILNSFLYMFHMPLFFICSGYFFKEITYKTALITFFNKKIRGLYIPYLRWSILFMLLHNMLRYLHLTESAIYQTQDYIRQLIKIVTMTDYELLIRPFWFIKELLLASVIIASFSMIRNNYFPKVKTIALLTISISVAIVLKYMPLVPLIGDCSLLFLCISYLYSGMLIQEYKNSIPFTTSVLVISFLIVLIGSIMFIGTIDMRFTTVKNIVPYYLLSFSGVLMVFCLSKKLENSSINTIFFYIGNHTMPILALNLLALKVGNLIKIWIYSLPMNNLSSYTVIYEYNSYFWVLYTMIGITIPLLVHSLFSKFVSLK